MITTFGFGYKNIDELRPEGFKQNIYSLLMATLAINILSLALPIMTLQVYDRILPNPGTGTLPVLITGVCLAILLEAILRLCRAYVIGRAGASYEHRLACEAMHRTMNADLSKTGSHGVGEHLNRMTSVSKLKDFYNGHALTVLFELSFVPLFFALIIYISHKLAFVPAFILVAFVIVSLYKGKQIRSALERREHADDTRFNFLIESLEGVHTIKAFALEKFFERRYEALEENSTLENFRVTQETSDTFNTGVIFSHLMVSAVICIGAWFVLNGMLTTGALIATLLLSGRMMQPVQKSLALWTRYQDYLLTRDQVMEVFTCPQRKSSEGVRFSQAQPAGRLEIKNIKFKYEHSDTHIFSDISLNLEQGDIVYISGAHGSGKTTLLNLVSGIYPPSSGSIIIDGEEITSYSPGNFVRHVGYIRARPLIFRGTIRDNITCFGQTEETQAREVAALLNVDKDVAKLASGFDTFLSGNNTDSISKSLRQRIAMARVLAAKPKIILFDSADRCLDKEGYALTYSLLARLKGKATMILMTDDLNIAALAERHYQIEDGNLKRGHKKQPGAGNIHPYKVVS